MRLVDYLIERIYDAGAEHIFFVPGTGCMHLTDALARHSGVNHISMHHEQAAAMAALSYAKYNGRIGACLVTTGCGGINTMTGLLQAWQDNVPCVFISGQAKRSHTVYNSGLALRQMGRQEADIISLVSHITKYAVMINNEDEIAYEIDKALYMATTGRKGPVWIDVPLDMQNSQVNPDNLKRYTSKKDVLSSDFEQYDLEAIKMALEEAERPIILAGNGIRLAGAVDVFNDFIEKYQIPVTYTRLGADLIETDNPLSIGMVGMLGASRAGNFAIQNADFILSIGSRLSIDTTGYEYEKFARNAKLYVIDIDEIEHTKNTVHIEKFIYADALKFLNKMNNINPTKTYNLWKEKCLYWKKIFPVVIDEYKHSEKINMYYFIDSLSEVFPKKAAIVSDAGNAFFVTSPIIKIKKGQRCITSGAQAEMGYSIPGAIGISYASNNEVIAITGDGSIMMNIQELATISFNKLPIKICVMNNNGYSSIRQLQNNAFRGRLIGTDSSCGLGIPSFEKIADAFELRYIKIEGSENLSQKIEKMLLIDGPVLCEVICKEDQEFISVACAFNSKKRLVNRPLEDQSPFLDRELFLSEMIVDPIDQ